MPAPQRLVEALERAFFSFPFAYSRTSGSELHREKDCTWFSTAIDFGVYNGVFDIRFLPQEAPSRVQTLNEKLAATGRAFLWTVLPRANPPDIAEYLMGLGAEQATVLNGMTASISEISSPEEPARAVQFVAVRSEEQTRAYASLYPTLFGAPTEAWIGALVDAELELFRSGSDPFRRYLGMCEGAVVAAASTTQFDNYAVLQTLVTVPEMRNRGIGHALLHRAFKDCEAKGAEIGLLWAGPGADKLYSRCGFEYACQARLFSFGSPHEPS
jgi:GNAT superfamily N-acetyltransferase